MTAITKRLRELAHAAANEQWREFSMRVPAEPERDADLVLISAAKEIERLRDALSAGLIIGRCQNCGHEHEAPCVYRDSERAVINGQYLQSNAGPRPAGLVLLPVVQGALRSVVKR